MTAQQLSLISIRNTVAEDQFKPHIAVTQDIWNKVLLWSCDDECRYNCMWKTVQGFDERGFSIPKFHGKVNTY